MPQEAQGGDDVLAGTRIHQQVSKRRPRHQLRHRPHRSGAVAVDADGGAEEEAIAKLREHQQPKRKVRLKMAHSPQPEEEGADGRGAEDPGLVHAWPRGVASLADS
jgi:hypothetical protein